MEQSLITKKLAPWFLLTLFALTCYSSQIKKAVTVDEFSHFPAGIYNISNFDWRMDKESPPLIKCIPAVSALITKPKINSESFKTDPNPWSFGYDFMFRNMGGYREIFKYGRCVIILLGCFLGWLLFVFAKEIYGYEGALFALFVYVLNPNIIAHSRLVTIDAGATCMIFLSVYCFWKFLNKGGASLAVISGITLGLAQLSKFTALILYPVFLIIFSILIIKNIFFVDNAIDGIRNIGLIKKVGYFFLILLISVFVINAGYTFDRSFLPLNAYPFNSVPLKKISSLLLEKLPVPLPYDYLSGFDSQLHISAGNNPFYAGYLMGEHSLTGWWYYYIIAFVVKNPVALSGILILTIISWVKRALYRFNLETTLCIWMPIIGFFVYFSFFTHTPIGIRVILPVFPLLFLAAGHLGHEFLMKNRLSKIIVVVLAVGYLIPSVLIFPNYLSYFNLASGGPRNGHRWLIDSNLDWGQDLPVLKEYMERKGIKAIKLGYFGRVDPKIYGINYTLAQREIEKNIYAVSVNFLVGRPYYLLKDNSKELVSADLDYFKNYRSAKPVDVVGHTLYIFDFRDGEL